MKTGFRITICLRLRRGLNLKSAEIRLVFYPCTALQREIDFLAVIILHYSCSLYLHSLCLFTSLISLVKRLKQLGKTSIDITIKISNNGFSNKLQFSYWLKSYNFFHFSLNIFRMQYCFLNQSQ